MYFFILLCTWDRSIWCNRCRSLLQPFVSKAFIYGVRGHYTVKLYKWGSPTFMRLNRRKIGESFSANLAQPTLSRYKDILLYTFMYFLMLKNIKKYVVVSSPFWIESDIVILLVDLNPNVIKSPIVAPRKRPPQYFDYYFLFSLNLWLLPVI